VGRTDERLRWFAEYNVRECWLVQLNRRDVTVVSFADKKAGRRKLFRSTELIRSTVLPEFHHALDELLDEEP
jgi:Uma2 family endonuclease